MTAPRFARSESPVVARTFLDSDSGAHLVITEGAQGWFEARFSDGHATVVFDFPPGRAGLEKLEQIVVALGQLKPRLVG